MRNLNTNSLNTRRCVGAAVVHTKGGYYGDTCRIAANHGEVFY